MPRISARLLDDIEAFLAEHDIEPAPGTCHFSSRELLSRLENERLLNSSDNGDLDRGMLSLYKTL